MTERKHARLIGLFFFFIAAPLFAADGVKIIHNERLFPSNVIKDFIQAAGRGDAARVREFIREGIDADAVPDALGHMANPTALMRAAENGHTEVVQLLIAAGADVNALDRSWQWLDGYKDYEKKVRDERGATALMYAVRREHERIISMLIAAGADVNARGFRDMTALFLSALEGDPDIVETLVKAGADVNARDVDGNTALMVLASEGHTETAHVLIDAGADLDAQNVNGWTALIYAAHFDHADTARVLVNAGADANLQDFMGMTALMRAIDKGHIEGAKVPRSQLKLDIIYEDAYAHYGYRMLTNNSPKQGRDLVRLVRTLIRGGADVNILMNNGKTALAFAYDQGLEDIVKMLRK